MLNHIDFYANHINTDTFMENIVQIKNTISVTYNDAIDNSVILDLKPYTPSSDRVEKPIVPDWCSHLPYSYEASEDFDWENEFLF